MYMGLVHSEATALDFLVCALMSTELLVDEKFFFFFLIL